MVKNQSFKNAPFRQRHTGPLIAVKDRLVCYLL